MKKLVLMLLMATPCFAQKISVDALDAATKARTIQTIGSDSNPPKDDETIVNNGLVFFSAGYQEVPRRDKLQGLYFFTINLVHNDQRVGCLTQEAGRVILILEDGSEINCSQISATDCDPVGFYTDFVLVSKGGSLEEMKKNFEKLQHAFVKRISVITSETTIKFTVKAAARTTIAKHFALIANALKEQAN